MNWLFEHRVSNFDAITVSVGSVWLVTGVHTLTEFLVWLGYIAVVAVVSVAGERHIDL